MDILVIGSDDEARTAVTAALAGDGHHAVACDSAKEALALAAGGGFTVALLEPPPPDVTPATFEALCRRREAGGGSPPVVLRVPAPARAENARAASMATADAGAYADVVCQTLRALGRARESSQELRAMADVAPVCVWLTAPDGQCAVSRETRQALSDGRRPRIQDFASFDGLLAAINLEQHLALVEEGRLRAEQANRLKDEFLSLISHELRAPLNPVLGWAELLVDGELDPGMIKNAHESILRNAQLLSRLVEDLLDLSQLLAAEAAGHDRDVDLGSVVGDAVEKCREAAAERGVRLGLKAVEHQRAMREGDREQLVRAFVHLLSRAIAVTPSGGKVEVESRQRENDALVTVRDGGPPLAPEQLESMFDAFRADGAISARKRGGLGIVLAIVRRVVQLHGGQVTVTSGAKGGASFEIRLPLGTEEEEVSKGRTPAAAGGAVEEVERESHG